MEGRFHQDINILKSLIKPTIMTELTPMGIMACPPEQIPELCEMFLVAIDDEIIKAADNGAPRLADELEAFFKELEVMYNNARRMKADSPFFRNRVRMLVKHAMRIPAAYYNPIATTN